MTLASWPEGLHHKPARESFRILQLSRPPVTTEFEDGPHLMRPSGVGRRAKLAYQIDFKTAAEYGAFNAFVETTLVDGSARFTMPVYVPASNSYVAKTVQIEKGTGGIEAQARGMGFVVSFTLIVYSW